MAAQPPAEAAYAAGPKRELLRRAAPDYSQKLRRDFQAAFLGLRFPVGFTAMFVTPPVTQVTERGAGPR